jgi:putative ABC transport system permease protein
MNLFNAVSIGLKEIWAHKFRSLLTMLGIILGVSSLVAMSALVKGMENGMKEALVASGGLEKVRVEEEDIPAAQRHLADQAMGITIHDVYALQRSAPLIAMATPEMRLGRNSHVSRSGKSAEWAFVVGTWPNAIQMNQHEVEHGRMFNEIDDELARNVCVIGTSVRDELFGSPDETGQEIIPIGESININEQPFRIIGMFKRYESEQDRKRREFEKNQPKQKDAVERSHVAGGRSTGGWVTIGKSPASIFAQHNVVKFRSAGLARTVFLIRASAR